MLSCVTHLRGQTQASGPGAVVRAVYKDWWPGQGVSVAVTPGPRYGHGLTSHGPPGLLSGL